MQQTGTVSRTTGRHIYAYCNLQTQQVIYSLKPSLHNASVRRQLPDTGANTSFVKLRKDLWHPLWSLSIPDGPHADAQGKHAFKKLREWRKLHETSWEPPPTLARPYSEKEIKKLQEELDDRGGKKLESVYDVIKRRKKYLRVNTVMDQRANSIADLAAVLIEQDQLGAKTVQEKEDEAKSFLEAERSLMLELAAKVEKGGLEKVQARIAELEAGKAEADRLGEADESKRQMNKKIQGLLAHKKKMLTATEAVTKAKQLLAADVDTREARARIRLQEKRDLSKNLVFKQGLSDDGLQAELDTAVVEISRLENVLAGEEAIASLDEYEESYKHLVALRDSTPESAAQYLDWLKESEESASAALESTTNLAEEGLVEVDVARLTRNAKSASVAVKAVSAALESTSGAAAAYLPTHEQRKKDASGVLQARSEMRRLVQRKAKIDTAFNNLPLLLEAEQGGIERLSAAINQLKRRQRGKIMREATDTAKRELDREINILSEKQEHMRAVRDHHEELVAAAAEVPQLEAELARLTDKENPPKDLEPGTEEYTTALKQYLPSFPKPSDTNPNLPKRGRVRAMQKQRKRPTFASKGIRIKWSNPLDAEYAQAWPQDVEHSAMGLVRHTAPHVHAEPVMDVVGIRQQNFDGNALKRRAKRVGFAEQAALSGVQSDVVRRLEQAVAEREMQSEAQRAAHRAGKQLAEPVRTEGSRVPLQSRREGGESMSDLLDAIR